MEKIVRIGLLTAVVSVCTLAAFAEESLTITTYYPSPQGSYQKLKAETMGVGDTDKDGSSNLNDVPDPATYPGQLVVANRLGVGVPAVLGRPLFVAGNTSAHTAAFLNNVTGVGVALGAYNATAATFASVQANSFNLGTQSSTGVLNLALNPGGGNVGINQTAPTYKLDIASDTLATTAGSRSQGLNIYTVLGLNGQNLQLFTQRSAAGSDWFSADVYLRRRIDSTDLGFIKWPGNSAAIEFGNNTETHFKVCSDGNVKGSYFCCGHTNTTGAGWVDFTSDNGAYIDVDTSGCGFSSTPMYFTTIVGNTNHWVTYGATSIYTPTATGFRVYVRGENATSGFVMRASTATTNGYYIQWCGIKSRSTGVDTGTYVY